MAGTFRSHGKLLLAGEYVVLLGAKALALPSRFGQTMTVESGNDSILWIGRCRKQEFIRARFKPNGEILNGDGSSMSETLSQILQALVKLRGTSIPACIIENDLDFPLDWGLGSSSTLINNLAQFAQVSPFELLNLTFGGSGYDIACAQSDRPIFFTLTEGKEVWEEAGFHPDFSDKIHFVHLNQKMNSREAMRRFESRIPSMEEQDKNRIGDLSSEFCEVSDYATFGELIEEHESIMAHILGMQKVKDKLFPDYPNAVKSLGAWGGDFVLALGDREEMNYFRNKAYTTILSYKEMVLTEEGK